MDITEYADVIGRELEIRYYPSQNHRFSAQFNGAEVKGDGVLSSSFGDGKTPDEALINYLAEIRGRTIVFNASRPNRAEFIVPETVTWKGGA